MISPPSLFFVKHNIKLALGFVKHYFNYFLCVMLLLSIWMMLDVFQEGLERTFFPPPPSPFSFLSPFSSSKNGSKTGSRSRNTHFPYATTCRPGSRRPYIFKFITIPLPVLMVAAGFAASF
jgi:hypothetical protein